MTTRTIGKLVHGVATKGNDVQVFAIECRGSNAEATLGQHLEGYRTEGYTTEVTREEPLEIEVTGREAIYDELIAPLVANIVRVCQQHDIPMIGAFQLDDVRDPNGGDLHCVTFLVGPDTSRAMRSMVRAYGKV